MISLSDTNTVSAYALGSIPFLTASRALRLAATVVMNNVSEFGGIAGLIVENGPEKLA
jgi:hypothetical protein